MKKPVSLFLLILLVSVQSTSQNASLSKKILQQLDEAEKEMVNAISNGDSTAFKKIAGPDYLDINLNGIQMDFETMLNELHNFKGITINFSGRSQRVFGNFVLKNGRAQFLSAGQLIAEVLYTQGWAYRNNKWQFVHWQGTRAGDFIKK